MVPLIERANYLETISSQPVLRAFQGLLHNRDDTPIFRDTQTQIETDDIYYGMVRAIHKDNKSDFFEPYTRISRRTVTKSSTAPFLYNDYLIFVIVTGVIKFQLDQTWIMSVMQARSKNRLTQTFEQILNGDFYGISGHIEVIFAHLALSAPQKLTQELKDHTYQSITQSTTLFSDGNDLIILCALFSYDKIIREREPYERTRELALIDFEKRFLKRCSIAAVVFYNVILFSLVFGIWKAANQFPSLKDNAGTISGIVGILGVSLGNILTKFRDVLKNLISQVWGHHKLN